MPNGRDRRGRSKRGARFLRLGYAMLISEAWLALTPAARVVLIEVAKRYNGRNNGFLALSARDAAETCRINKDTATRAFTALQEKGFIELATPGSFHRKVRHAAEYRVTWERCDKTQALPSRAYQTWRSAQKPVRK